MLLTTIIALAGCTSDPLEPGAGNSGGSGTNSLLVTGRAEAAPRLPDASASTDYTTSFAVSISLSGTRISTGTVTIQSRTGSVDLTWHDNSGQFGQWEGTMPATTTITAPTAGATLDATIANTISIAPGSLETDKDTTRTNTIELRRANHVVPTGAVAGSDFTVQVEQQIEVLAQPAP